VQSGGQEGFERPNERERRALFVLDCEGLGISGGTLDELIQLTGANGDGRQGFTYSDIRTRVMPEARARAFPDGKITEEDLIAAAIGTTPSPAMREL
jgi:hypothetical protein